MKQARIRLIVAAVAFAAWIGWLIYLALPYMQVSSSAPFVVSRPAVILSRPQFLGADVSVVAHVEDKDQPIRVLEVRDGDTDIKPDDEIVVENLHESLTRPPTGTATKGENKQTEEWETPGDFIIPLRVTKVGRQVHFSVAPLAHTHQIPEGTTRIYPKTPQTLEQFRAMPKAVAGEK
jgi:hypothetical protein